MSPKLPVVTGIQAMLGHAGGIYSEGFSPNGRIRAGTGPDDSVSPWDVAAGDLCT